MLTLAVLLAVNPHPDLWLDDAAFAAKYCRAEWGAGHRAEVDVLRAANRGRGRPDPERQGETRAAWAELAAARWHLDAAVARRRADLRADPLRYVPLGGLTD